MKQTDSHVDYVRLITYSLGLCNSICNPFIYALFNAKFRAGCKEMFRVSVRAMTRKAQTPRGGGNVAAFRPAEEEPQKMLGRRGGFHGTKGGDEKKKQNKESQKKENTKSTTVSVGQLIGRRFRSLTDGDAYKDGSTESVQLVSFQRTVDPDQVVVHFANSSLEKSRPLSNSTDNCVKFTDDLFCQSSDADSREAECAEDRANGKAGKSSRGYSILNEEVSTPVVKKRTRSDGSYVQNRKSTQQNFPGSRNSSMPAMR